jgi:hypothetical protein
MDIEQVAVQSVNETKESIADLNVMQMNRGLRSDGSEITPPYAPITRELKAAQGLNPDIVTLHDVGDFNAATYTKVEGLNVITGSTDWKSAKLERKYSRPRASIFGLSEKYRQEYIGADLRPVFKRRITDLTGLRF